VQRVDVAGMLFERAPVQSFGAAKRSRLVSRKSF
jgi:hypothetical protein